MRGAELNVYVYAHVAPRDDRIGVSARVALGGGRALHAAERGGRRPRALGRRCDSGAYPSVGLIVVLPLVFGLAKRVEPDLGALNLARLLAFANTAASFVLFIELFSLYIIFREPFYLNASMSGFTGGITALLVAFMKPSPYATAPILPGLKLRFYPLVATLVFSVVSLLSLGIENPSVRAALLGAGPYSFLGGYFGWYHLRFLNKNLDQTRGDVSDEFALVTLLPDFFSPVVGPVANFCFNVVKLCGYFKDRSVKPTSVLPMLAETTDDPIAERRKARAMKALDEKLAKLANKRDESSDTAPLSST
ncbi:hypothetical protein FI667_g5678, partial [Globisporangium splendens]